MEIRTRHLQYRWLDTRPKRIVVGEVPNPEPPPHPSPNDPPPTAVTARSPGAKTRETHAAKTLER